MHRLRISAAAAGLIIVASGSWAQEVTLPLERYDELRARAAPEPPPEPEPAEPLAFEEASLTVAVGGSSARITQELTLALYGDAWQTAPLGETGTFVDADFGTAEGRLQDGAIEVRGAGRHHLRLTSVVSVSADDTATRPTWRLRLRLPEAALVHGVVEVAAEVETVEAEGAIVVPGGDRRWTLAAAPGAEVRLALLGAAAAPERESLPVRFEAEVRLSLPGKRRYALADAGRAGAAGRPPQAKAVAEPTPLARRLGAVAIPPASAGVEVFPRPPGFTVVQAAWSALSTTPALRLRITEDRDRKEWF